MKIDVLSLITPDQSIIKTQGLQGSTPSWTYLSNPDANGIQDLVYIKGPGGFPWDWMKVGSDYIYQLMTENVWSDPSTGKLCRLLGQPRLPRWIDWSPNQVGPAIVQFTIGMPQTNYVIIGPGGMNTGTPGGSSDAEVRCTFRGPYPGAAVGDLPAGEDWCEDYERNGAGGVYKYKETITHRVSYVNGVRFGWGRRQWQQFKWLNGQYVPDLNAAGQPIQSQTTKLLLQPCPVPVQKVF